MKRIMIAVDFSDQTQKVMDTALELAVKYGSEVILLHTEQPKMAVMQANVLDPYGSLVGYELDMPSAKEIVEHQIEHDEELLSSWKAQAEQRGLRVKTDVFIGNEISGILEDCERYHPDLFVMGLHRKGFLSRLWSDNPELALVKKAPCPLLLIPE